MAQIVHLADRSPQVTPDQLLAGFHPSYRFGTVSFDTYIPDPAHPSQAQAVERLRRFAADLGRGGSGGGFLGGLFGGEFVGGDVADGFAGARRHQPCPAIRLSAAARASSVTLAPESMRAISSRRCRSRPFMRISPKSR